MFLPSAILLIVFHSITFTIGADCIDRTLLPRVRECCRIPPPFPDTGLRECDRKARRDHTVASYVMQKCKMECYYQKLEIINENELFMDQVNQYLERLEHDAREFYMTAFQTCDEHLMDNKENLPATICYGFAADLDMCVQQNMKTQCPMKYWQESKLCNNVKAGYKICRN